MDVNNLSCNEKEEILKIIDHFRKIIEISDLQDISFVLQIIYPDLQPTKVIELEEYQHIQTPVISSTYTKFSHLNDYGNTMEYNELLKKLTNPLYEVTNVDNPFLDL